MKKNVLILIRGTQTTPGEEPECIYAAGNAFIRELKK